MKQILTILLLFAVLPLFSSCKTSLIRKKEVVALNREFENRIFVARKEIRPEFLGEGNRENEVLFPAGTRLKIWVESSVEWVRVKAYRVTENREQTPGKTIIYLFHTDLGEQEKPEAVLMEKIDEILREERPAP